MKTDETDIDLQLLIKYFYCFDLKRDSSTSKSETDENVYHCFCFIKGPSIKNVRTFLVIFDPPPPPCLQLSAFGWTPPPLSVRTPGLKNIH